MNKFITAGLELDKLIAELVGNEGKHNWDQLGCGHTDRSEICLRCGKSLFGDYVESDKDALGECVPGYSTDCTAAMDAAAIFRLFDTTRPGVVAVVLTGPSESDRWWKIADMEYVDIGLGHLTARDIGSAETLPLAICRAILALKERQ